MAKKAPVKKTKRRLKRSVRRSLAAVLMVTSIAVAAIPVPENEAAPDSNVAQDGHTVYSYNELKTHKSDEDGSEISALPDLFQDKSNRANVLGLYEDGKHDPESEQYDNDETKKLDIKKSLKIFDSGAGDELTWEYKYYTSSGQVVLCKYNERYPRQNVDLEADPNIEYFAISSDLFNAYFDIEKTATTNPQKRNGKVIINASDTLSIMMEIDPYEKEVTYTYNDFLNPANFELTADKAFLETYAQTAYGLQTDAYKKYQTDKADYDSKKATWENAHPGETYPETEPTKPSDLQKADGSLYTMSELIGTNADDRMKFFCAYCSTLSRYGDGYTLKPVRDTTSPSVDGTAKYTYVAYGGTAKDPDVKNVDGYMVTVVGEHVSAIGTHAFTDVGNVDNISLPQLIKYIGDEAFLRCNSVKTLDIADVALIGNRAFQSCNALTTINMGTGVKEIGVESFADCRDLTNITFSPNTAVIGAGAFANCPSLTTLNMNSMKEPCEIEAAAFYDCAALTEVKMDTSPVTKIGDSAFACISGDRMTNFVFPADIADAADSLGDRLFCNRAALKTVVFPKNYGRGKEITIPESIFHGCSQLNYVEFPTEKGADATACANLKYETGHKDTSKELFADVVNPDFYVSGPKVKTNGDAASPRKSTWQAVTKAHNKEPGYVPYLYYENGMEFYEICSGDYLQCIRKNEDGTGTLVSCELRPGATTTGGTLVIPDQVGGTKVVAIDGGCFSDTNLTKTVKKLVINDNIQKIDASTFENIDGKWNILADVTIGSAVEEIGNRAFWGCTRLTDITFKTPNNNDYSKLGFPDDALKTNGDKLTIHGDIKEGYRPFSYAMNPQTYVKDSNDGIRVCYQSRWDSPESKHLSVMYGASSHTSKDGKSSYVTLLDYPKYDELEDLNSQTELKQHSFEREQQFYDKYSTEIYDDKRVAFALAWSSAIDGDSVYNGKDSNNDPLYGPWINENFCENWEKWKDGNPNDTAQVESGHMFDWLFEPLVVQAVNVDPEPYFDNNPFNFMTNYKECKGNEENIPRFESSGELIDYMGWNDFENQIISSVEDIVIPAGIESIDTQDFYKANRSNYLAYFLDKMEYVNNTGSNVTDKTTVPGLFSGWIEDYTADSDDQTEYEKEQKGNDRIKSVIMTSVKYLPDYAFDNCERLSAVTLGDAMESIGALPFRDCGRLVSLSGNNNYPAENGILYERQPGEGEEEKYDIVECLLARGKTSPIGEKTVTVLSDPKLALVSGIDKNAFEDCNDISFVDLSAASLLTEIPDGCFRNAKNLANVRLSASVNDIHDDAFAGVCYESTQTPRSTIEIPGVEVSISDAAFGVDSDYPNLAHAKERITIKTSENTAAYRYATYYAKEGMNVETYPASENTYSVVFMDYDGTQIGNTQYITNDFAEEPDTTELEKADHRPGYVFSGWLATNGQVLNKKITQSCIFIAQYKSDGSTVDGQYTVEFYDSLSSKSIRGMGSRQIGEIYVFYVDAGKCFNDMPDMSAPENPTASQPGFVFLEWRDAAGNRWSNADEFNATEINSNMRIMAMYTSNGTNTSGNTTNTSGNATNTSNNTTNPGGNTNNNTSNRSTSTTSTSNTSSSTSSSSTSTSSTSSSGSSSSMYTVLVENGSGSGSYAQGATVIISAAYPADGMKFSNWTTQSNGVTIASVSSPATTFVMPGNNVTVTANFVPDTANTTAPVNTAGTTSTTPDGNTTVDITKPGISNKDLATANVNGSTDNFIVKISETDAATQAVAAALTNKYGSLENLLYYAMDITLWDSTGTYQLTGDQVAGLSVDITIPIPDALVAYGGNNMAGAVVNGDQLENLNESFTTINGVPCIRFTATHFSPYTIYVDTGNLTEGMLDVTPKTGDPIHPKWFLSIGLACLSIALFMKKDKKTKVKTA